ncbi:uncharacterized protein LOC121770510 [Salvia splendens]|uniref:uncharacterized protein LOC121770510 n=1 Tax=Salvia splendens TaxID=180675 RepID=UPI001C27223E|nr:uncharacterized protein LOC121770510 [Salvia splendens]
MSDQEEKKENQIMNFGNDFAAKFGEFIRQSMQTSPNPPKSTAPNPENPGEIVVTTKLSGDNYPLWENLMTRAIGGKGLSSHIDRDSVPPPSTDPYHETWKKLDHIVFRWIINHLEPELVNEVSQYLTARELWEGLAVTYGSGGDSLQVYDLHVNANTIKQGDMTLEQLWFRLQNMWMTIDRRRPNRMKYAEDIALRNEEIQEERLYQFLIALNESHEATRKDILKRDLLPSVKNAYAIV